MHRCVLTLAAPLIVCAALGGCASATPAASSARTPSAAAGPSNRSVAPSAAGTTSTPAPAAPATGQITFRGTVSGTMTITACPDGTTAQLSVDVDGQRDATTGIIDKDDFTFIGSHQTAYTLAKGAPKPEFSGRTYTVRDVALVGITSEGKVTANGSVTCP